MRNRLHPKGKDGNSRSTVAVSMPTSRVREFHDLAWAESNMVCLEVDEPYFATPNNVTIAAHRGTFRSYTVLFNRKMLGGEFT